jgi:stalled ribosome alternative rescue factor ArfA
MALGLIPQHCGKEKKKGKNSYMRVQSKDLYTKARNETPLSVSNPLLPSTW